MRHLYLSGVLAAAVLICAGCLGQTSQSEPVAEKNSQLLVGATEVCQSAGGEQISVGEAISIANQTAACAQVGAVKSDCNCNKGTATCWLDIEGEHQGCAPACVINVETKEAAIDWRCTGVASE